jgi:hypothetical protein
MYFVIPNKSPKYQKLDIRYVQYFAVPPRVHMESSGLHPKDYLWYAFRVWVRVRIRVKVRLGLG